MPEDVTQVAFLLRYALFDTQYEGFIRSAADEEVDTWRATLFMRHHFGKGWGADVVVPTGIARGQNVLGEKTRLTGLGDVRLNGRYDLAALWGAGAYRPSVVLSAGIALPTGEQARFGELSPNIPVTVLALGRGAFAGNLRAEATQFVSKNIALTGWLNADVPLSLNALSVRNGVQLDYGMGVTALPLPKVQLSLRVAGQSLQQAESEQNGVLVNSGGTLAAAEGQLGYRVSDRFHISLGARTPVAAFLKGEQVAETASVFSALSVTFGLKDEEDEHDHGEGDGHDHGDEEGDSHDAHSDDEHAHSDDEHAHSDDEHAHSDDEHAHSDDEHAHSDDEHAQAASAPATAPAPSRVGDVKDLARGGASFDLAALKAFSADENRVVVVDFWAEWCAPCKALDKGFLEMSAEHPRLSVRKVEVPDFECEAAKEHIKNASGLPVVWVISPSREIVKLEKATQDQVNVAVSEALSK